MLLAAFPGKRTLVESFFLKRERSKDDAADPADPAKAAPAAPAPANA